jgi:hypothetical protein
LHAVVPGLSRLKYFRISHEALFDEEPPCLMVYLEPSMQLALGTGVVGQRGARKAAQREIAEELGALRQSVVKTQEGMDALAPRLRDFLALGDVGREADSRELARRIVALSDRIFALSFPEGALSVTVPLIPVHAMDPQLTRVRFKVQGLGDREVKCGSVRPIELGEVNEADLEMDGFLILPPDGGRFSGRDRATLASAWASGAEAELCGHLFRCTSSSRIVGMATTEGD